MKAYHTDCTHSFTEIDEMRSFLTKSYAVSLKPFNWRLAMLENWFYASRYLEHIEYFTNRVHVWRNAAHQLVAFLIRGTKLTHLQMDYAYRFLEPEIFEWAEQHSLDGKAQISTMVYDWDLERQALLAARGYQNQGAVEDLRIYNLHQARPKPSLPSGYRFTSLADYHDSTARIDLENCVWGVSLDDAWFRGKSSAPSYSLDWDLLVASPENRLAAFNLVWLYPANQTAEIDPVGTHPDFRRRGLARALILESFQRMRAQGIHHAYIGSETQDPIVSQLYASLQPAECYQGSIWTNQ